MDQDTKAIEGREKPPPKTEAEEGIMSRYVKIERSFGQNKTGIPIFFVRPMQACHNKSHRCVGFDKKERTVWKWFYPEINYYEIKNCIIGSNSERNALREFWRICEKEEIGIIVEVKK